MSDLLRIIKINEVDMRVDAEQGIRYELNDEFTFMVPGAKFMPSVRNKIWDGKIRLYNRQTGLIYIGLLNDILEFAKKRNYECIVDDSLQQKTSFSLVEAQTYLNKLKLPFEPRDYQISSYAYCVKNNRALIVSPTGSGKSLIIYSLIRHYAKKTLLIVPTTSLVEQMYDDFSSYGFDSDKYCHRIYSGKDKDTDKPIIITTWQSVHRLQKNWFKQFDLVIGDECHLFKAKSLTTIMTKLEDCKYRFGFTGTLDGTETNELVLKGLFGTVKQFIKTKELIENEHLSNFKIKCLILKHKQEDIKNVVGRTYQDEIGYLVTHNRRNTFISNLVRSLSGNSLLLFQYVEKQGKVLYDLLKDSNVPTYFVYGGVNSEEREKIRKAVIGSENNIIIASYGTFSTGINIPNLDNLIFGSPSKSRIRNLQSIGRVLRTSENKTRAVLFDISDDLRTSKKPNITLTHFNERVKIYNQEGFDYQMYKIDL
jgi:superfamily II DNA or RNA helicase